MTHKSHALWADDVYSDCYGEHVSTDNHHSESEAVAVCKRLESEGFGGDGQYFPIKTWMTPMTPIPFEEEYPEEAQFLADMCADPVLRTKAQVAERNLPKKERIYNLTDMQLSVRMWKHHNFAKGDKKKPPAIDGKKVGRNEQCPCGSGKKYKRCCNG
jgi:hypothetical protein